MNILYVVIILVQVGVIVYFYRKGKKSKGTGPAGSIDESGYEGSRALAFRVTPAQLGLNIPPDATFVYGIIMDWNTGDAVVSLAAYITGAANLFFSTGGGLQGGGKSPEAGVAAVKLVSAAAEYAGRTIPLSDTSGMPPSGCVRFYLLTNNYVSAVQEQVQYLTDGSSPWLSLFELSNEVIGSMGRMNQ